jgi:cytidylate kinase
MTAQTLPMAVPVVAVDGPSGTGKGTICYRLATWLGWHFLDSGALYRVLGQAAQRAGVALHDEKQLADLANKMDLRFARGDNPDEGFRIILAGEDVSQAIRTEEAGSAASRVAALPAVRAALLDLQHGFRQPPGLIADGRDMGTVVFPDAPLKIFLTASAEERAKRRYKQLKGKGIDVSLPALLKDIAERDTRDRERSVSPLVPAVDAHVIDTSVMSIDAVFGEVMQRVREQGLASN